MYEYVDNGNLEQWLHGNVGPVSPLTWDIRMKIAIGTAKGFGVPSFFYLAQAHETLFILHLPGKIKTFTCAAGYHLMWHYSRPLCLLRNLFMLRIILVEKKKKKAKS